jgi:hypothetical protein
MGIGVGMLFLAIISAIYFLTHPFADEPAASPITIPSGTDSSTRPREPAIDVQKKESTTTPVSLLPSPLNRRPSSEEVPRPAQAQDSASVVLVSTPAAKAYIDSLFVGSLPIVHPLRLTAGMHTILFTHPSFEPIVRTIRLAPGEELAVKADFLERAGYLRCAATPWAEISVDDLYRDTTPFERPLVLTAGPHRVRFHHPAFKDSVWQLSIAPRETVFVSMSFNR